MQEREKLNIVNQLGFFNIFNSGKLEIDTAHKSFYYFYFKLTAYNIFRSQIW